MRVGTGHSTEHGTGHGAKAGAGADAEAGTDADTERDAAGRRVLIVSASMGSGHHQVSQELQRRLTGLGHDVVTADFNELMLGPTGGWLARVYPWLVNRAPKLYDRIYRAFFLAPQRAGERVLVPTLLAAPRLRSLVDRFRPDVVVSTFHLSALAVARIRARGRLGCPAVTLVTTFAVHNLWVHPDADMHLCISSAAAEDAARRSGRPAAVCGPVVRPMFTRPPSGWKRIRRDLGLSPEDRLALIVAGSLGLGDVGQAAGAIARHPGWVPVVTCGQNEELRRRIEEAGTGIALGWVEDMAGLMDAADVLVENAGGLSAKEALYRELPVVTFRPIAGHGRDDANALARLGLTDVVDDEQALVHRLDSLTSDSPERAARIACGRALLTGAPAAEIVRLAGGERDRSGQPM